MDAKGAKSFEFVFSGNRQLQVLCDAGCLCCEQHPDKQNGPFVVAYVVARCCDKYNEHDKGVQRRYHGYPERRQIW